MYKLVCLFFIASLLILEASANSGQLELDKHTPTRIYYEGYDDHYSNFTLPDECGILHRLSDCEGRWCILFFPIDATREEFLSHVCLISRAYAWLKSLNVEVICISALPPKTLYRIKKRLNIKFTMLSDYSKYVGSRYGVYSWDGDTRLTMIIDPKGNVKKMVLFNDFYKQVFETLSFFMEQSRLK